MEGIGGEALERCVLGGSKIKLPSRPPKKKVDGQAELQTSQDLPSPYSFSALVFPFLYLTRLSYNTPSGSPLNRSTRLLSQSSKSFAANR